MENKKRLKSLAAISPSSIKLMSTFYHKNVEKSTYEVVLC